MPRAAAFFDLDRTLIAGSSGLPWARAATKAGLISRRQMASWGVDALRFRLRGATDEATAKLLAEVKEVFRGTSARQIARLAPEVLVGVLPRIYPEMLEEVYARAGERDARFETISGHPIDPLYTQDELPGFDYDEKLGNPGEFPFTRGIYPSMYR